MSPKGFGPESKKFNTIEECAVRTLGTCANVYCDKMFCVTSICFAPGAYSLVTATACSMVPFYCFVFFCKVRVRVCFSFPKGSGDVPGVRLGPGRDLGVGFRSCVGTVTGALMQSRSGKKSMAVRGLDVRRF